MRGVFRENFKESELGVRTKKIIELVTQKIFELDPSKAEEEAKSLAEAAVNRAGIKTKNSEATALFFMSAQQAKNLAELALICEKDKKSFKRLLKITTASKSLFLDVWQPMSLPLTRKPPHR